MSSLQAEIRKKLPFDLPEQEALLNIQRTSGVLAADFDRLFAAHGLTSQQYNVLRILRGFGREGLPCLEIASQMVTRDPDITRLVDRLEKAGLVARHRTATDRRVVLVSITDAGVEKLAGLDQPVNDLHIQQLGHLTPPELVELNRLLVKARTRAASPTNLE